MGAPAETGTATDAPLPTVVKAAAGVAVCFHNHAATGVSLPAVVKAAGGVRSRPGSRSAMNDYRIHSEARAGHWVAWAVAPGESRPAGAVTLSGQTRQEAEANARRWVERISAAPGLLFA